MSTSIQVTLPTDTVSGAVEYLSERVEEGSLVLTGQDSVGQGDWVRFEVLLRDGSNVLEGVGRCGGCAQSLEVPHGRFDVLLEQLTLDGSNEIMFERIMLAYQTASEEQPESTVGAGSEMPAAPEPTPTAATPASIPPKPSVRMGQSRATVSLKPIKSKVPAVLGSSAPPAAAVIVHARDEPRPETINPPPLPPRSSNFDQALPNSEGAPETLVLSDELNARVEALVPQLRRARLAKKRGDAVDLIVKVGLAALEAQMEST